MQRKVANQRQDWTHKVAADIVSGNSFVATEKLNLKGMTAKAHRGKRKRQKAGLNRSILDVGMGMLRNAIEYKLAEAGGIFIEVPTITVKPSQTCPNCGYQEKKTLADRVHDCPKCGCTEDRDVAAAIVMLNWVRGFWRKPPELDSAPARAKGLGTSLSNVDGTSSTVKPNVRKDCGGYRQLSQTKRQKLSTQRSG